MLFWAKRAAPTLVVSGLLTPGISSANPERTCLKIFSIWMSFQKMQWVEKDEKLYYMLYGLLRNWSLWSNNHWKNQLFWGTTFVYHHRIHKLEATNDGENSKKHGCHAAIIASGHNHDFNSTKNMVWLRNGGHAVRTWDNSQFLIVCTYAVFDWIRQKSRSKLAFLKINLEVHQIH